MASRTPNLPLAQSIKIESVSDGGCIIIVGSVVLSERTVLSFLCYCTLVLHPSARRLLARARFFMIAERAKKPATFPEI
jgi:hypothetical protein